MENCFILMKKSGLVIFCTGENKGNRPKKNKKKVSRLIYGFDLSSTFLRQKNYHINTDVDKIFKGPNNEDLAKILNSIKTTNSYFSIKKKSGKILRIWRGLADLGSSYC